MGAGLPRSAGRWASPRCRDQPVRHGGEPGAGQPLPVGGTAAAVPHLRQRPRHRNRAGAVRGGVLRGQDSVGGLGLDAIHTVIRPVRWRGARRDDARRTIRRPKGSSRWWEARRGWLAPDEGRHAARRRNTSPEPFSNWILSLAEDVLRRRPGPWLALKYPAPPRSS